MVNIVSKVKSIFNKPSQSTSSSTVTQSVQPKDFGDTTQMTPTPSGGLPQQSNVPKKSSGGGGGGGSSSGTTVAQSLQSIPPKDFGDTTQMTPIPGGSLPQQSNKVIPTSNDIASQIRSSSSVLPSSNITTQNLLTQSILLPSKTNNFFPSKSTRNDLAPPRQDVTIYSPGTVYESIMGFEGKDRFGRAVPTTQTFFVEPDFSSRLGTKEDINFLGGMKAAQRYEDVALSPDRNKLSKVFGETKGAITIISKEEVIDTKILTKDLSKKGKGGAIAGGIIEGLVPSTKGELIGTGLAFGTGGLFGASFKGVSYGLSKIPKVGAMASNSFKLGSYGVGAGLTGLYTLNIAGQVEATKDYGTKGKIIGGGIREVGAFGLGFGAGKKVGSLGVGLIETRGRTFLPLESITRPDVASGKKNFPTAPQGKQLGLFKSTAYNLPKELTEGRAGGFHVTGERFFGKGKDINPSAGGSELLGLYVSSEASIYFSQLVGKGRSYSLVPSFKSILSGERPAIAFLQPKAFRKVGYGLQPKPVFEGQRSVNGRYAFFKEPAKKGVMDVPGMKTEIEAIARVDAGAYEFSSAKFYTIIKGTRVPIDVFKAKGTETYNVNIPKGNGKGKGFSSSEYSNIARPSIIEPYFGSSSFTSGSFFPSSYKSSGASSLLGSSSGSSGGSSSFFPSSSSSSGRSSSILSSKSSSSSFSSSSSSGGSRSSSSSSRSSSIIYPPRSRSSGINLTQGNTKTSLFGSFNPRYTPSLTAISLNLKGKVPKSFRSGNVDPLSRRLILETPKRKKRRK